MKTEFNPNTFLDLHTTHRHVPTSFNAAEVCMFHFIALNRTDVENFA